MKINHEAEYEAIPGFFVDFFIRDIKGKNVIIEFDGPSHYRKDKPREEKNTSKTRKDILKHAGFEVLVISYLDMPNHGCKIKLNENYFKQMLKLE